MQLRYKLLVLWLFDRFWSPQPAFGFNTPLTCPGGIQTAIGCVPTNANDLINRTINTAFGLAGGVAFLLMLYGSFQLITSGGNPEKVKAGQEIIQSAIIGLLFILFSMFLLALIGVRVLAIPGFGI